MKSYIKNVAAWSVLAVAVGGCAEQQAAERESLIGSECSLVRSKPGETATWQFQIRNLSKDRVQLKIAAKSCTCLQAELSSDEVQARGVAEAHASTKIRGHSAVQGWVIVSATSPQGEKQFEKLVLTAEIELPAGLTVAPRKVQMPANRALIADCRLDSKSSAITQQDVLNDLRLTPLGRVESLLYWESIKDGGIGFGVRIVLPSDMSAERILLDLPGVDCTQASIELTP